MNIKFQFSEKNVSLSQDIIKKYPKERRVSAIMPLLTLAQNQNKGHLTSEIIDYLAEFLNVSTMSFYEVAKFYSMYRFVPVGKYHFQFCKSVVCLVTGANNYYDICKEIMKIEEEEVSEDGLFSLCKVECLGACVNAPAIKVNDIFVEDINEKSLRKLIADLQLGKELEVIINVQKTATMNVSAE